MRGTARFASPKQLAVERDGARELVDFDQCIIAAGSEPAVLPGLPNDPRIIDSTGALELKSLPQRMLVVGGGIIGLEMATVYDALGVKVSVVELTKTLIPGCDRDLVKPLEKRIAARYEAIMLGTRVHEDGGRGRTGITVHFEGDQAPAQPQTYGLVLVAVGRSANGRKIARREGRRRGRRARPDSSRQAAAHERAAHLRDRRHRRPADARAQGEPRRQGRGRGGGGARRASSTRASCRPSRTRIPRSRGSGSRRTKRRRAASRTRRARSRGPRARAR